MANIIVTTAADSGAGSLRAALEAATTGTTIQFDPGLANQTILLTSGQLEIAAGKQITIDGQGASGLTISGNNASRIFAVNSNQDFPASLTVRNLTLANGYTNETGGAIYSAHKGKVVVEQVTFRNNVANQGGGAIYSAWENDLTVIASKFEGNQAIAANSEQGGGAIAFISPGNFTVRDSDFLNNRGINGGAINSLNGKLTIQNSRFIGNDTTAAYYANGIARPDLRGYGGAVFADRASSLNEPSGSINISDSVFERNSGRGEGGGVYLYTGTQDQVTVSRSLFKDNQVLGLPTPTSNGSESLGGGLVVISNGLNRGLTLDRTAFINNVAGGQGGGLWTMDAPTTIQNSTFSGNQVTGTSTAAVGGGLTVYSPTRIINSTIANNTAGWVGGGLAASSASVAVQNTIFYNNSAANSWGIQQHTNRELEDLGGNIQFPPKRTTFGNDANATANIRLADPGLGSLAFQNGTWLHPLLASSSAINQGMANGLTTDQSGALRADGSIDSGAMEFNGIAAAPAPAVSTPAPAPAPVAVAPSIDTAAPTPPTTVPVTAPVSVPVSAPVAATPDVAVPVAPVALLGDEATNQGFTEPEVIDQEVPDLVAVNIPMVIGETNTALEESGDNLLQGIGDDAPLAVGEDNDQMLFTSGSAAVVPIDSGSEPDAADPISPCSRTTSFRDLSSNSSIRSLFAVVADQDAAAASPALITYDPKTGILSYNPNGSAAGFGEGGAFACLNSNLMLPAIDFFS